MATPDQSRDARATPATGEGSEWSREHVEDLAQEVLATLGLASARASLVKFRESFATLRVDQPRLLLKIGASASARTVLDRSLKLATWLSESGFPVAAPAAETSTGVLSVRNYWAGLWRWEDHEPGRRPDPRAIGELLRSLHELLARCPVSVPALDLLGRMRRREGSLIRGGGWLEGASREFLASRLEEHASSLQRFQGELGVGPIHGDFKLSNVLLTRDGPLLVDLDTCSTGPREWDLALLARTNARGWREDEWPSFSAGYGYDLLARSENDPIREHAYLRTLLRWLSHEQGPLGEPGRKLLDEWRRNPGKACFELDWRGATRSPSSGP